MFVVVVINAGQHLALLLSRDIIEVNALQRGMQILRRIDAPIGFAARTCARTPLTHSRCHLGLDIQAAAHNIKALHWHRGANAVNALLVEDFSALSVVAGRAQAVYLEPPVAGELALLEYGTIWAEE